MFKNRFSFTTRFSQSRHFSLVVMIQQPVIRLHPVYSWPAISDRMSLETSSSGDNQYPTHDVALSCFLAIYCVYIRTTRQSKDIVQAVIYFCTLDKSTAFCRNTSCFKEVLTSLIDCMRENFHATTDFLM